MIILDVEQGSLEWKQARCGRLTASRCGDMMARTKSGPSASRAAYLAELVLERLTDRPFDHFVSKAMQDGTDRQPEAIRLYSFLSVDEVTAVGLVQHPRIADFRASPDGLVGEHGLVEVKCPEPRQHLATLLGDPPRKEYLDQMQSQMACTGRAWCDFVSFSPLFPAEMQLHRTRFARNGTHIAAIEAEAATFLAELAQTVATLRGRFPNGEAA